MELTGIGPHREFGDDVELAEELTHHLAGVVALAELLEPRHDARQRLFGLTDGHIRVVLALPLETGVMFEKFLSVEVREALTG